MKTRGKKIIKPPFWAFTGLVMIVLLLAACVAPAPVTISLAPTATPEPPTATPEPPTPTPEPPTATPEPATSEAGESSSGTIFDQIFPAGHAQEVDLVINNCGNCHSWVCPVIGQRPAEHWITVKANHRDFVSGLSDEEVDLLFNFLAENFNDKNPAPKLPEGLQGLGCTTQQ